MAIDPSSAVFVTGGSGFLGRNIVRALVERGHEVRALARSSTSSDVVAGLGAVPVRGDLADEASMREGMRGARFLVHCAADTNHGLSTQAQDAANLDGTRNVYRAACEAEVKRALHIGTEAVLLEGRPLHDADETTPIAAKPAGGYSRTKAAAERIALEHLARGLEIVVIRPRFVWGRDDTTALPALVEAARSGKLAWIGGGRYRISTTHIANVVHGALLALERGRAGQVYFITDGEPVEFRSFITKLLATRGVAAPPREVPRALVAAVARLGDRLGRWTGGAIHGPMSWQEYAVLGVEVTLNISKARRELGYEPEITREQGLAELAASSLS